MPEDLGSVARFVEALAARERRILVVVVAARAAALTAAGVAVMFVAAAFSWDRAAVALALTVGVGAGGWLAVGGPLARGWARTGDLMRQARLAEARDPELAGRLVTTVEGVLRPTPNVSQAMLALVARRAAARLRGIRGAQIHPATRVVLPTLAAAWAWLVLPLLLWWSGPAATLRWWFGGASAVAAVAGALGDAPVDAARVGDLVLRYRYPAYTGLEDKVVPNSTGDVEAPPGTTVELTARSADPAQAAGLEVYGQRLDATLSEDGRDVNGRFDVQSEPGVYQIVIYRGAEPERSRAFAITPTADLPPDVTLDAGGGDAGGEDVIEVALDDTLQLDWRARDDYGVRSVSLQVDGRQVGADLYQMVERRAEVFDVLSASPRELGLSPGDEVTLRIAAWDNDTVAGSKAGFSQEITVVVLGARGLDRRAAERQAELLTQMIPVLARHLTDAWPPADTSAGMAQWGEDVAGRYAPLFAAVEAAWDGMVRDRHDALLMEQVTSSGTELIRYTQVAFEPGSTAVPKDAAFDVTAGLRDEAIVALEEAVLAFHRMLRNRAFREIAELAKDLDSVAAQLEALLEQPEPDALALLAKLDQLERLLAAMMNAAARLDDGGLREFVNQREGELGSLMEQVRDAIANGDLDEAKSMMERLAEQIEQLGEGIEEEMSRRESAGEDAMQAAEELLTELERLEQEQARIQQETQALREEAGGEQAQQAAELWKELDALSGEHAEAASAYERGVEAAQRPFWERSRVEGATDDSERLRSAVGARDLRGATEAVEMAMSAWEGAAFALERTLRAAPEVGGPTDAELAQLRQQLLRIRSLLEQLQGSASQASPDQQARAEQLQEQQRQLENELQQARDQASQLEREFPVKPQGMQEALDEAADRMRDAGDDLGRGRPMEAEGSQGVASRRLEDAQQSLRQAMQQASEQAQGGSQSSEGQEGRGEEGDSEGADRGGQGNERDIELDIPTREEFRTPEEYRRALLEGMEGEVPEEYRSMKRRYYEELVHQ